MPLRTFCFLLPFCVTGAALCFPRDFSEALAGSKGIADGEVEDGTEDGMMEDGIADGAVEDGIADEPTTAVTFLSRKWEVLALPSSYIC